MAFRHGKDGAFSIADASGTVVDISEYLSDVSISRSGDTAETSTLGTDAKSYVAGMTDATLSISGLFHPTVHPILASALADVRAFEYGPQGSETGSIRIEGSGIGTEYSPSIDLGSAGTFSFSLQVSGAVTDGVY